MFRIWQCTDSNFYMIQYLIKIHESFSSKIRISGIRNAVSFKYCNVRNI